MRQCTHFRLADAGCCWPPLQVVTPWDVAGGADGKIDYHKIVKDVGASSAVAFSCGNICCVSNARHIILLLQLSPVYHSRVAVLVHVFLQFGVVPIDDALMARCGCLPGVGLLPRRIPATAYAYMTALNSSKVETAL